MTEVGIRFETIEIYLQADLAMSCSRPFPEPRTIEDPLLVVEVRSASTERRDLVKKLVACQRLASMRDILLVDIGSARIDHFAREGESSRQRTQFSKGALRLPGLEATIDLAAFHEGFFPPAEAS